LAEVLITLAIIGIVAAITIPSIVANHQKRTLETQFAKAYRTVSQAVNLAVAEHGGIGSWAWKEEWSNEDMDNFVTTYLAPHLNIVKFCPADGSVQGCFADVMYKRVSGADFRNISREYVKPKATLADGMSVMFHVNSSNTASTSYGLSIAIDTNGANKPNRLGYDFFEFHLYPQTGEFLPAGIYNFNSYNEETKSFTRMTQEELYANCNPQGGGAHCAARVIQEGFKINY